MACELKSVWADTTAEFRLRFKDSNFERWLELVELLEETDDSVWLGVPNRFVLEWVEKRYLDTFREVIGEACGRKVDVHLQVASAPSASSSKGGPSPARGGGARSSCAEPPAAAGGSPRDQPRFEFESFVVSIANRPAVSALRRLVEGGARHFNPLFLFGSTGNGKTHLLRAAEEELRRCAPSMRVRYVEGERFLNSFVLSLKNGDIAAFRERHRRLDVLFLDDFQVLAHKRRTQEELVHTLDALVHSGSQVVLAGTEHPRKLEGFEAPLVNRLVSGLVAPVRAPDPEARRDIVAQQADRLSALIPEPIRQFIADNVRGSVRELLGALHQVVAYAATDGELETQSVREILADALLEDRRRLTAERILEGVAHYYRLDAGALASRRRDRLTSLARKVAIYLCREHTEHSLSELGRLLGGRSGCAVRAAEAGIRKLLAERSPVERSVEDILELLHRR